MKDVNAKSVIIGAVGLWVLLRFVAPKVPALNVLRP
jgi:hypothetical protein